MSNHRYLQAASTKFPIVRGWESFPPSAWVERQEKHTGVRYIPVFGASDEGWHKMTPLGCSFGVAATILNMGIEIVLGALEHDWIMTFHSVGNIPTDKLIFFRGVGTTNQS